MAMRQKRASVSARMGRVRSSGSRMELEFASRLRCAGINFRKQHPILGKPDFVLPKWRIAIFCDSHFWHGYRWSRQCTHKFKTHSAFWRRKIERNRQRDKIVNRELKKLGWTVVRFWEHQLKREPAGCVLKVQAAIIERQQAIQ
jgi:DNA mismatch endonuclease, patch repair protein